MMQAEILIVDDDAQIRRTLRATLVPQGYSVSDARSGEEALEKLRAEKTDVVLLDLNMPGMGGLAACREIRRHSDVAIIVVTVRDSETDKVQVLDAGADDYITKPFSTPELLARIRAALRRLAAPPDTDPKALHLEGLTIDFAARRVHVRNQEVRLTPKEFDLLRYLVSNANVVIPHRKILQAVWGPDYGDEVEYLRVFMNHLRKKIEPNPAKPKYLLTEPWVGYRLSLASKV
jgi:two-component system, OmpR family, KDP operon response regulator KdpE